MRAGTTPDMMRAAWRRPYDSNLSTMTRPKRSEIKPGSRVQIVEKQNQRTGKLTEGIVARILTSSPSHPHGIKVMLDDGKVGRVQAIVAE
jgi:uncharacterized repeat protein (TIGR03833 family)